ncbi:helix-turn-helix domain-containing protein [Kaistella carnis]|uniref:XRE family transcriptional regulator n=1 Tax=Kaistella carnis TaxID=1241979 RepID=A0A3G8XEI9_9FLAO|nr:helix-turn-helix transcriptional regulator [Kaistella carnis]AZI31925.1 XRE family transcriptional regulator [Kaistella carnis]
MKSKLYKQILEETPLETKIFVDKYSDLILRINQILRDKGISQKELAENMDKKPSEISRWLSGNQNITLRSIAKLEAELGETLIEIPTKMLSSQFKEDWEMTYHTFCVERKVEKKKNIDTAKVKWQQTELAV